MEKLYNDNKQMVTQDLKIDFFRNADNKAKYSRLKRNVDEIMNQRHFLLNERRSK